MDTSNRDNFQPIHNPYIVGNPIREQKMFFGREDDFTFIKQKVTGGKKGGLLVLCGSRRSGKTSILFQVMNGRLGDEFFPVLIDMQAMTVENDLDFLIKLARGIIEAIGDSEISLEKDFLSRAAASSLEAFQHLITRINQKLGDKKLILLFDEYEIFESHIGKKLISTEILNLFANWIEHKRGVFIVFTGSDKLEERKTEYWGHFLGKALHRRISFLTRTDTLRLIEEPLAGTIEHEAGLPERIYELTAGQPFYTQVICQALVDHLNEVQRYTVTDEDLQSVAGQIIENPLPQMIFAWNSLTTAEKLALSIIGELNKDAPAPVQAKDILAFGKAEKIGYRIEPNTLNETLERLFYHDILEKAEDDSAYTFKMDVWRRWTARMHSIWQVIDEIKSGEAELGEGITREENKRGRRMTLAATIAVMLAGGAFVYDWLTTAPGSSGPGAVGTVPVDSTRITIVTQPVNAYVFLGDTRIGQTPLRNKKVPASKTALRIELAGYTPFERTVALRKDEPFDTTITLLEKTGGLRITSTPTGAAIALDGKKTGFFTPRTFENLSINASHEVRLTLSGHNPRVAQVPVEEGATITRHFDFARSVSSVHIMTEPVGASIYVDDDPRPRGETPSVHTLTYGRHRLLLKKEGYSTEELTVVVPMRGDEVRAELQKLPPGKLTIKAVPYAEISIDGEMITQASRREVSLDQGVYTITLKHPTYGSFIKVVRVVAGKEIELSVNMPTDGVVQQ